MMDNRVARSGLIVLDPEIFKENAVVMGFDLQPYLWQGLALREREFRQALEGADWQSFKGAITAVFCSVDAIIPPWAWMLICTKLNPVARYMHFGTRSSAIDAWVLHCIENLPLADYAGKRVMIKGCGTSEISPAVYMSLTNRLTPVVKTLMFGEPCSSVPVYKS